LRTSSQSTVHCVTHSGWLRPGVQPVTPEPACGFALLPCNARKKSGAATGLLLVFLAIGGFAGVTRAQINPFPNMTGARLSNEDFSLLIDAGNALLRRPKLAIGDATQWQNPQTGSKGTITVQMSSHRNGMPCYMLLYQTDIQGGPSSNSTRLNWCKAQDGAWKILS
jgi:surface antigen